MTIGIPFGVAMVIIAWYLVTHRENWQWRQIILGALIGLIGLGGAMGATVDAAVADAFSSGGAVLSRMANAAVGG